MSAASSELVIPPYVADERHAAPIQMRTQAYPPKAVNFSDDYNKPGKKKRKKCYWNKQQLKTKNLQQNLLPSLQQLKKPLRLPLKV